MSAIEWVLVENRVFPPSEATVKGARISGMGLTTPCARKPSAISRVPGPGWRARTCKWLKPFTKTLDESEAPFYRWFEDGELNASANCLDKHVETGKDVANGSGGILVIKRPWPSMIRTIWGDPERFRKSYFPQEMGGKLYLAGDGAVRSIDRGYFRITGRIDDVLNVSGHRLGTMEIESALVSKTDLVAEAAVVGRPDDLTGEAVCAFVVLKRARPTGEEAKKIANELRNWVAKEIGPIAKPKDIRFGDNLPKTRSGKIMRRLLRSIAKGEQITQDITTLENPAILDQLSETN
jgi:acyl-coenzyme A synthetase/AMP-(fatty) acid ligase